MPAIDSKEHCAFASASSRRRITPDWAGHWLRFRRRHWIAFIVFSFRHWQIRHSDTPFHDEFSSRRFISLNRQTDAALYDADTLRYYADFFEYWYFRIISLISADLMS
jgi:hypothetical protein